MTRETGELRLEQLSMRCVAGLFVDQVWARGLWQRDTNINTIIENRGIYKENYLQ